MKPLPKNDIQDLIDAKIKNGFFNNHFCNIGRIYGFNISKQTATIEILINRKKNADDKDGIEIPPLLDVPVVIYGGGGYSITTPIKQGDECLVLFNDRSIDNWYMLGDKRIPREDRIHNYSDAIAIVGINNQKKNIQGYSDNSICINKDGKNIVEISDSEIKATLGTTKAEIKSSEIKLSVGAVSLTIDASGVKVEGGNLIAPIVQVGGIQGIGGGALDSDIETLKDVKASGISLSEHEHPNGHNGNPTGKPIKS